MGLSREERPSNIIRATGTNPWKPQDCFRAPTPGPLEYDSLGKRAISKRSTPGTPRFGEGPVAQPTDHSTSRVQFNKSGSLSVPQEGPGPGEYNVRPRESVQGLKMGDPSKGDKAHPSVPGPQTYKPRYEPTRRGNPGATIAGKNYAEQRVAEEKKERLIRERRARGLAAKREASKPGFSKARRPGGYSEPDAIKEEDLEEADRAKTKPGPGEYNPRGSQSRSGPVIRPPVYDPKKAEAIEAKREEARRKSRSAPMFKPPPRKRG